MMVWYGMAMVCFGIALIGGIFPLWRSATLSPDSIRRRTYWTAYGLSLVLMFIAALPDWRGGIFLTTAIGLCLVANALHRTNHFKIRGRIYAASPNLRTPDRPPALSRHSDDV